MSTVVIVSAEQTGSSVCFCSAVTFACSEKLSQHQITPKDFQNKVFPQLDREDNLYYEDDEKIQWKARSVSIPPNKISLFLQDLRHALKRCQARLKFKEQRAVLTGWLFFFFFLRSHQTSTTLNSSGNMRKTAEHTVTRRRPSLTSSNRTHGAHCGYPSKDLI